MMPVQDTRASLLSVRSRVADDLAAYYNAVMERFDRTPWGNTVSRIRIPAKVSKKLLHKHDEHRPVANFDHGEPIARRSQTEDEFPLKEGVEIVAWEEELATVKKGAIILGAPGEGKTFLTATMMIDSARAALLRLSRREVQLRDADLPIHVSLEKWAGGESNDLVTALLQYLRDHYSKAPISERWLQENLFRRESLWVLDGLDQVGGGLPLERLSRWLPELGRHACRIVITCRTLDFDPRLTPASTFVQYQLARFEWPQIQEFAARWYGVGDPRTVQLLSVLEDSTLLEACRTPLISTMACVVNDDDPLPGGIRRVDLYERMVRRLQDHERKTGLTKQARGIELRHIQALAWSLFTARPEANLFVESEILASLETLVRVPQTLFERLVACRILVESGSTRSGEPQYSFIHRTFLEFLAARHMAAAVVERSVGWSEAEVRIGSRGRPVPLARAVDKKSWLPEWSETIVFLAGCLGSNATQMITMLSEARPDIARHRSALAIRCLAELSSEERDVGQAIQLMTETIEFIQNQSRSDREELIASSKSCRSSVAAILGIANDWAVAHSDIETLNVMVRAAAACRNTVSELIEWLRAASEPTQRKSVLAILKMMMPRVLRRHSDVVPVIADCLQRRRAQGIGGDDETDVRKVAAELLGEMGEAAGRHPRVIRTLLRALDDADEHGEVRAVAAKALAAMPESAIAHSNTVRVLLGNLDEQRYQVRWETEKALQALAKRSSQKVVPRVLKHLGDTNDAVRARAAKALAVVGETIPIDGRTLRALTRSLTQDSVVSVRSDVARALRLIGEGLATQIGAVAVLIRATRDGESSVRRASIEALRAVAHLVPPNTAILPALIRGMGDEDEQVRKAAVEAMQFKGTMLKDDQGMLSFLTCLVSERAMRDTSLVGRSSLRDVLGPEAVRAVPILLRLLGAIDASTRVGAAEVLEAMAETAASHAAVVPALIEAFRDSNSNVRAAAIAAIKGMVEGGAQLPQQLIPNLLLALDDEAEGIRFRSIDTLELLDAARGEDQVIASLLRHLGDEKNYVRWRVVDALLLLGVLGSHDRVIVLAMLRMLREDQDWSVQRHIHQALAVLFETGHREVVDACVRMSADPNPSVRNSALSVLQLIGEPAAHQTQVIVSLLRGLRDEDCKVRRSAALALSKMGAANRSDGVIDAAVRCLFEDDGADSYGWFRVHLVSALEVAGDIAARRPDVIRGLLQTVHGREFNPKRRAGEVLAQFFRMGLRLFEVPGGFEMLWTEDLARL